MIAALRKFISDTKYAVYYVCLQDLVHHPWACFTYGCCDYTTDGGLSAEHSDRISVSNL